MRVVLAIYVAFLSVALIGCTGTGITTPLPTPTPTPTQSPAPTPTPSPTASPTPSPTPTPTPVPITGSFLYDVGITPSVSSGLRTFQIDPQTHLITALTGSTFNAAFPIDVDPFELIGPAADKTGQFLLTAFHTNPDAAPMVQSYRRNSDGSFTNVTNMTLPVSALLAATMDPQNRFFYIAALEVVPVVYVLSLDPISGALTLTSTVTLSVAPASQDVSTPSAITTNSTGNFLYVTVAGSIINVVVGVEVHADGSLTPTSNIEIGPGVNDPNAVFANDSNVYVGDKHVGIFAYSINPTTGALTPVTGSPFITNSENVLAFAQLGNFFYVGSNSPQSITGVLDPATLFAFQIQSGGGLVSIPGSPFQPAFNAQCLTIQGSFLYVGDRSNIQGFAIDALTGKLTSVFSQPTTESNRGCVALP
jgi:hypothetical protein